MLYLCLGYLNSAKMDARPKTEIEAVMTQCQPHLDEFHKSGQVRLDAGVESETIGLRRENGQIVVTDGSSAKTEESLGSVFLLEALDIDDAIRVASLHPSVQIPAGEHFDWRIEIRPVHYLKQ
ncbi:hypothetical protein J9317_03365 [Metabacillus sp. KIGAM252]|uniref:YCII-related domain-containing protein n=1 Tax=Metabacillus flavus TaxID=2823519 RepID=A0ABS5LB01_9BACI|nr:YciI family protein [Metabacillus flavus]MBS2967814.1 hypothetical protein [Metabacillus flavus]